MTASGRLWARWGLDPEIGALDGVWIEWSEGRLTRVEACPRPPGELPETARLDGCLLTPGFLNAHAHLDYSFLRGRLPRGRGFVPWLRAMVEARRAVRANNCDRDVYVRPIQEALAGARAEGTVEIWDVASYGWARDQARGGGNSSSFGVDLLSFEEWVCPSPDRWRAAWETWLRAHEGPETPDALSPHSCYSVAPEPLAHLAGWARARGLALAIHLSESPEERELLVEGRGALAEWLGEAVGLDASAVLGRGRSAIERARRAGLLTSHTLAIHANLPEKDEATLLAASGTPVVFCPRSHTFFGYPPWPLAEYTRRGVRMALGTDSLASNDDLSMRGELRAFSERASGWAPRRRLGCATGALLGETPPWGGRGRLAVGWPARWVAWRLSRETAGNEDALFEALLDPATRQLRMADGRAGSLKCASRSSPWAAAARFVVVRRGLCATLCWRCSWAACICGAACILMNTRLG